MQPKTKKKKYFRFLIKVWAIAKEFSHCIKKSNFLLLFLILKFLQLIDFSKMQSTIDSNMCTGANCQLNIQTNTNQTAIDIHIFLAKRGYGCHN